MYSRPGSDYIFMSTSTSTLLKAEYEYEYIYMSSSTYCIIQQIISNSIFKK